MCAVSIVVESEFVFVRIVCPCSKLRIIQVHKIKIKKEKLIPFMRVFHFSFPQKIKKLN